MPQIILKAPYNASAWELCAKDCHLFSKPLVRMCERKDCVPRRAKQLKKGYHCLHPGYLAVSWSACMLLSDAYEFLPSFS